MLSCICSSHWERVDELTIEELMRFIKGPDFPTGGVIYSHKDNEADDPVAGSLCYRARENHPTGESAY